MKRLLISLLLLPMLARGAVTIKVDLTDFQLSPVAIQTVSVTALSAPTASSASVVIRGKKNFLTDGSGVFWISNAIPALYSMSAVGSNFMVLIQPTDSGVISAHSNMVADARSVFPLGNVAWSTASSDLRYARAGDSARQTPWTGNEDAAGFSLTNASLVKGSGIQLNLGNGELTDLGASTSIGNFINRNLSDPNGATAIDYSQRSLLDDAGALCEDWQAKSLYDQNGGLSLGWAVREGFDSAGHESIDWNLRRLFDSAGNVTFDWSSGAGSAFIPSLNGTGTNTALTNFVYILGTNVFARSNNGSYTWTTNVATFANGIARVRASGVFQSDPGSTLSLGSGHNFIAGDDGNTLGSSGDYHSIAGGIANSITPTVGSDDVISGGQANRIRGGTPSSVSHSSILGGLGNLIETNASAAVEYAVISGGRSNYVNHSYGWAGGLFANAVNQGAFVWADSVGGSFSSVGDNTFNLKVASLFATNDDAAGHFMSFSNGVLYAPLHNGSGNQLTNSGLTVTTNSTAPANTTTIRAWLNVTNDSGKVGKIPIYY